MLNMDHDDKVFYNTCGNAIRLLKEATNLDEAEGALRLCINRLDDWFGKATTKPLRAKGEFISNLITTGVWKFNKPSKPLFLETSQYLLITDVNVEFHKDGYELIHGAEIPELKEFEALSIFAYNGLIFAIFKKSSISEELYFQMAMGLVADKITDEYYTSSHFSYEIWQALGFKDSEPYQVV